MSTPSFAASETSTDASAPVPALDVRFDDRVPVLRIPSGVPFEALRGWLREALPAREEEIGGRSSRLDIGEREIKLFDLRRLIHLLRDEFSIEITGLYVRPAEIQRYAERELKLKLFPTEASDDLAVLEPESEIDDPTEDYPDIDADEAVEDAALAETEIDDDPDEDDLDGDDLALDDDESEADGEALSGLSLPTDLTAGDLDEDTAGAPLMSEDARMELASEAPRRSAPDQGRRTLTVHKTLRSGAVVRFDGDIIVFGDVNPGANLIATGNVVVLGALKGMAHAGALGDESYTILAFDFRPTQVRIGRKIAIPPSDRKSVPELVVVRHGEIVIEPYTGRMK
jgi:septum site-determining protein MinC